MKKNSPTKNSKQKIIAADLDQQLYRELRKYNVVKSSDAFSELLGKGKSYIRSIKCRRRPINLENLLSLQVALEHWANEEESAERAVLLRLAEHAVKCTVKERSRLFANAAQLNQSVLLTNISSSGKN